MFKVKIAKVLMYNTILLPSDMLILKLKTAKYFIKADSILYAIIKTCINIALTKFMMSQFAKNPSLKNFNAIN